MVIIKNVKKIINNMIADADDIVLKVLTPRCFYITGSQVSNMMCLKIIKLAKTA